MKYNWKSIFEPPPGFGLRTRHGDWVWTLVWIVDLSVCNIFQNEYIGDGCDASVPWCSRWKTFSVNILQFVQSRAAGWIIQLRLDAHQCFTVCHPPSGGNVSHTLIWALRTHTYDLLRSVLGDLGGRETEEPSACQHMQETKRAWLKTDGLSSNTHTHTHSIHSLSLNSALLALTGKWKVL